MEKTIKDAILENPHMTEEEARDLFVRFGGKPGFYTITKLEGENNDDYVIGHTETGFSLGIVVGVNMYLESPTRWFRTSNVQSLEWTSDTAGEFTTTYSKYKFLYIDGEM